MPTKYQLGLVIASTNILNVAVGHTETKNGLQRKCQTGVKSAVSNEASTTFKPVQLSLF
ncbi:MAG: hypothetical protein WBB28_03345 [Crinalium sp.]